ncbi:MAG: tyrosine-type recombinase/integrase [Lacipirellulaceae bacterium]
MVELQRITAMRPGEVCQMRAIDIDRSGNVWVYVPREHKTEHHGHVRRVYLGPQAQGVLQPWLHAEPEAYLFSPREAVAEQRAAARAARKTKVQPSQQRRATGGRGRAPQECYTTDSYYYAIRRACGKAGVASWRPNQLRHTAATEIRRLHGIEAASILLGHRGVTVTQVYAERDEARAVSVAAECG